MAAGKTHLACAIALFAVTFPSLAAEAPAGRPNFVVIMAQAQGWSSTSTAMDDSIPSSRNDLIQTPSLDRLCREGMRFASAYAASPRCTPSRAALFTGKSPAQLHMTFIGEGRREEAVDISR